MAKARRKVDNQAVDLDLEDTPEIAIAAPELPETAPKKRRGRPRKIEAVEPVEQPVAEVPLAEAPASEVVEADDVAPPPGEKIENVPSPEVVSVVESPVIEAVPPAAAVPDEPVQPKPAPRRGKKSSPEKAANPETERFWHLKRMR